jgi:hypothetical protein
MQVKMKTWLLKWARQLPRCIRQAQSEAMDKLLVEHGDNARWSIYGWVYIDRQLGLLGCLRSCRERQYCIGYTHALDPPRTTTPVIVPVFSSPRLGQVFRSKAHGQELAKRNLSHHLGVLHGGEHIVLGAHLARGKGRGHHVHGSGIRAEFTDELSADAAWSGGRGWDVAGMGERCVECRT